MSHSTDSISSEEIPIKKERKDDKKMLEKNTGKLEELIDSYAIFIKMGQWFIIFIAFYLVFCGVV